MFLMDFFRVLVPELRFWRGVFIKCWRNWAPMAVIPNNQLVINALKMPQAQPIVPQYRPPVPVLNPNLAKDAQRVQGAIIGTPKANSPLGR